MRTLSTICMVLMCAVLAVGIALSLLYQIDPETFYKVKTNLIDMTDDDTQSELAPQHLKPTALDIIPMK